jgi:diguanylate cyclase (GGDEF)-like protein
MNRLESLAASPHSLIINHQAPLVGVLARCLVSNTPFASNALTLYHEFGGAPGEVMTFRFVAIVPLHISGRLIGAILADNVFSEQPTESDDLKLLSGLGNLAALAIDRARLHAKTVSMTEVDGLTGVYNRRYYERELRRAMERCQQSGKRTSIVVFDLDHFKRTNDQHGHLVGDQVLKDVAHLIRSSVRQSDRVARYGGEEFVLLLGETSEKEAAHVARKLCRLVKASPLAGGKVDGLTLSAGVASTDGDETHEQLFQRADQALYRAKSEGRDRVLVWRPEIAQGRVP